MKTEDLIIILSGYNKKSEVEIVIDSKPYEFNVYHDIESKGKKCICLIPVNHHGKPNG